MSKIIGTWLLMAALTAAAADFESAFKAIMARPEYKHSRFGVEIYSIDDGKVLYGWNAQELFVPGSTTKILAVGSALELLGPDFRFHTKVYRSGAVKNGVLKGDLILVASGDPNLSNRIQPDGTMVFENEDHSYDGFALSKPVPGDPLAVIRELASKVKAAGITRIEGRVKVDASLFPEGARELGTRVVMSPAVVNDNVVDVMVSPGAREGDPATITVAPKTAYVQIANEVKTTAAGETRIGFAKEVEIGGGLRTVSITGSIAVGAPAKLRAYRVPVPSRFAEVVFAEALEQAGVKIKGGTFKTESGGAVEVAEHVSPPLLEEAKVTLKVSQNLHASLMPMFVGSNLKKDSKDPLQAGFDLERAMLEKAGLDLTGAVQNDGAGGAAYFTPDFMVRFLLHVNQQPFGPGFFKALPVLGKDGTLFNIQTGSPAAGRVHAKTGTFAGGNALTPDGGLIHGKGLAGYIEAKDGRRFAFAAYINFVPVAVMNEAATGMVGQALGEIAAAAYGGFAR
jgi:D-alanyl-D-alanine carboxypeptidase/D-alanyl-D-alanine-endopeptidase (penicillin-binding protein 4)